MCKVCQECLTPVSWPALDQLISNMDMIKTSKIQSHIVTHCYSCLDWECYNNGNRIPLWSAMISHWHSRNISAVKTDSLATTATSTRYCLDNSKCKIKNVDELILKVLQFHKLNKKTYVINFLWILHIQHPTKSIFGTPPLLIRYGLWNDWCILYSSKL